MSQHTEALTEREKFEAWANTEGHSTKKFASGEFISQFTLCALDAWQARAALAEPAQEPDEALTQALQERDDAQEMADSLAEKIAEITNEDIGEHSNLNCPWHQALSAAEEFIAQRSNAAPTPAQPVAYREWVSKHGGEYQYHEPDNMPAGDYAKHRQLEALCLCTPTPAQPAEVMLNGLTEAETNSTASVSGLTQPAEPLTDAYVIDLLVAAGHVTREVVEQAREIAGGIGIKEASK